MKLLLILLHVWITTVAHWTFKRKLKDQAHTPAPRQALLNPISFLTYLCQPLYLITQIESLSPSDTGTGPATMGVSARARRRGTCGPPRQAAVLSAVSRHCTGVTPRQALLGPPSAKTPAVRPTHRGGGGLPGSLSAAQHQLSGWMLTIKTRLEEPAAMPCVTPLNRMRFSLHAMLREEG